MLPRMLFDAVIFYATDDAAITLMPPMPPFSRAIRCRHGAAIFAREPL